MKIKEALGEATKQLSDNSISDTPHLDASLILSHLMQLTREQLYTHYEQEMTILEIEKFSEALQLRLHHTPIAYILNRREFYGRDFFVNSDVLIPRGDTETLVETALNLLSNKEDKTVLDLCTGSGCIGISIALEDPQAKVTLSDISEKAIAVATKNALLLQAPVVQIIESDLFEKLEGLVFSLIATNPPYIAPSWYKDLSEDVLKEPELALLCKSEDGLSIIKSIITSAPLHLHKEGYLMIECDYRQIDEVMEAFRVQGFKDVTFHKDLGQRRRVVSGRYSCTKN